MSRARVLLLNAALGPLDYRVPPGMAAPLGQIVVAPLGPRRVGGVVWEDSSFGAPDTVGDNRLRALLETVAAPPMTAAMRRLVEWVSAYYLAPPGAVLRMALPGAAFADARRPIIDYALTGTAPARMTPQRSAALAALAGAVGTVRELAGAAGVSEAVIRGLVSAGTLAPVAPPPPGVTGALNPDHAPPALSAEQRAAAETLVAAVAARQFAPILLDGVTGSGKTEVYLEAVAAALRAGRQALVLLPEIALTQPLLHRFADRFGAPPATWHSGMGASARRSVWHDVAHGAAPVVVGARSALFLPFADLAVIIVDEAHEASFKQDEGVHYHGRDTAVKRAQLEGVPVVLATATPPLESLAQVEAGRYRQLVLPARFGGAALPDMAAVDLRRDPPDRGSWLSPPLVAALAQRLERGEQSLLFLNRRGYAPLTLCRSCGHRLQCPNCSTWMVEHRLVHRLACHHCGHVMPPPGLCPECGEADALVPCGPGVERVADEVQARFPTARTAIVTSDTLWSPARAKEFVTAVEGGLIDIIIGTQLVTKGYHFPLLTLVGVVDADLGLDGGDLRAGERLFQQMQQVAGRAGRGARPGQVLLQTRQPDAPVMAALVAGDRDGFLVAEAAARRAAGTPPYGRLAALIISGADATRAQAAADALARAAPRDTAAQVYGPAPAPLAMLRGRHRFRLLVHAPRGFALQAMLDAWVRRIDWPRDVRLRIDIDPYNFQ